MVDSLYPAGGVTARQSIGYLVRRAFKLMRRHAKAVIANADFTLSQWITLQLVADGTSGTAAEIARELSHNTGATTRLIDQLEERGLLRRRARSSEDRRVIALELTEAGKEMVEEMHPRMTGLWSEFLQDFTPDEVKTLIDLLQRLVDSIDKRSAQ